ncbi:tripartite tricarboxylate transporter substrate-binding protein [Rhodoferax ferrireducens]|uniref:tripartite tricarboxylate transporter substrate-binding protein n=1 Tax=Rhodoferax ferrireducens TaxID=192843 RepID=UPI00130097B8|nr:tripartite tricarboxylate transporter substrate-binding protein [Rhodoferax ferrireducens]
MTYLDRRDAIVAMLASLTTGASFALAWPAKAVIVKVAYPAGGPADVAMRELQPALQRAPGQAVVIENVPGAGGSIAARTVLSAAPGGHTLLVSTGNDVILAPLALATARYRAEALRLVENMSLKQAAKWFTTESDKYARVVKAIRQEHQLPAGQR